MDALPGSGPTTPGLPEARQRFIDVWGQMAGAWGISRTMAEVHALLFITGESLCTDDVMDRLEISRGNASMSLRALLDWGIVERAHRRGDRKEYFRAEQDVWSLFRAIVRERLKREADPLLAALYEIRDLTPTPKPARRDRVAATPADAAAAAAVTDHNRRLDDMLDFLQTIERLGQRFVSPTGRGLQVAASALTKLQDLVSAGQKPGDASRAAARARSERDDARPTGGGRG